MPVGVALQGSTTTSTRIIEKVLLDLNIIIILDEMRYMCLLVSL